MNVLHAIATVSARVVHFDVRSTYVSRFQSISGVSFIETSLTFTDHPCAFLLFFVLTQSAFGGVAALNAVAVMYYITKLRATTVAPSAASAGSSSAATSVSSSSSSQAQHHEGNSFKPS
jgi:hypothetical protein